MAVLWLGTLYAALILVEAAKCGLDLLLPSVRNQLLCLVGEGGRGGANDCNDHSSTQAGKFDWVSIVGHFVYEALACYMLLASKTCDMCVFDFCFCNLQNSKLLSVAIKQKRSVKK